MTKTVLLTGGCGFIGSHILDSLIQDTEFTVVVLEGLSYAASQKRCRFSDRIRYVFHDLRAPIMGRVLDDIGGVDHVIHCAAESHVPTSIEDPLLFVHTNVVGTANLLEYANYIGVDSYIQISSTAVADSLDVARHSPKTPYAATKAAADDLAVSFHHTFNMNVALVYSDNCFGLYQHTEKFVPTAIRQIRDEVPVLIYGAPRKPEYRRWVPVRKVCRAVLTSIGCTGLNYRVVNGHWASPYQVAHLLGQGIGKMPGIVWACGSTEHVCELRPVTEELGDDLRYLGAIAVMPENAHWLEAK